MLGFGQVIIHAFNPLSLFFVHIRTLFSIPMVSILTRAAVMVFHEDPRVFHTSIHRSAGEELANLLILSMEAKHPCSSLLLSSCHFS
jgi:DUF1365 family protein